MIRTDRHAPRLSLGAVGWILLLGFLGWQISPQLAAAFGVGSGGESMPALAVRTLDGVSVTREELAGKVVLGLSTDNADDATVRSFLAERGIAYPVAMATAQVVRDFGGVPALPTSFLIGRNGTVRQRVKGISAELALRSAVNHLLDEPEKEASR